jgi:glutaredoxin
MSCGTHSRTCRVASVELFGMASCPHTLELREWLEMRGIAFTEYDVELDASARARLQSVAGPQRVVPVLIEDGKVTQVGWQGRGCAFGA